MGGLIQKEDDYKYIWKRFMDPNDRAYDVENPNKEAIWLDPNRNFPEIKKDKGKGKGKTLKYDKRGFMQSLSKLIAKAKKELQGQ